MQNIIESVYTAAKWDWPDFEKPQLADYARHVQQLQTSAKELERYGADIYLALACATGDERALRALKRKYFPILEDVMSRSGFSKTEGEDVLQQVMLHLCAGETPRMFTYAGRASLSSWLCVTTLRFAVNMRPRNGNKLANPNVDLERLVINEHTPELKAVIENARPAFQSALRAALDTLGERERTLLRLCFVDGLSIDAMGSLYGVHRATAARWIADIRRRLLNEVKSKLSRDLGLSSGDFESLAFLVRSQLQLSLIRVFGAA